MKTKINFENDNILFISNEQIDIDIESSEFKKNNDFDRQKIREKVEPWLTAVFQSEHLSLLVGSGLPIALVDNGSMMSRIEFSGDYKEKIKKTAENEAKNIGRGKANFEDDLRVAIELLKGYDIIGDEENSKRLREEINNNLTNLANNIIDNERKFLDKLNKNKEGKSTSKEGESLKEREFPLLILQQFLLSFSTRTATRDRLNIFTTNYDRFIEFGLDEAGILILDRFIGKIKPIMRFHRIDLDYHYNPPGIRGEPRYVESVVRFTKLHGSIDWQFDGERIIKMPIPFGAEIGEKYFEDPFDKVVIYPNSSKAIETSFFPYSELFRDFSTAICRPNSVLVTYGYGFGDSHINRIIKDMLTISSTHMVIISYNLADGRIKKFVEQCNESQLTLIIGSELGNIENLTNYYLPKPAIDRISDRLAKLQEKRAPLKNQKEGFDKNDEP